MTREERKEAAAKKMAEHILTKIMYRNNAQFTTRDQIAEVLMRFADEWEED